MKLPPLLCCGALLMLAGSATGQDPASTPPPMPSGPLLKRAPDMSTWTVTSQNAAPPKPGQTPDPSGNNQPKPVGFRQAVVIKTGKIIDEQIVDGMGRQFEIWHYNGMQAVTAGGSDVPVVAPDSGGKDIYTTNFANSDFAGLDWVSAKTYAGMQKVMGRDCIIFRGTVNPLPSDVQGEVIVRSDRARLVALKLGADAQIAPSGNTSGQAKPASMQAAPAPNEVSAVACIDLETRLPVAVTFGQETRTYAFGQPPTSSLVLPAAFASAMGSYQKHISNLSRAPAAP